MLTTSVTFYFINPISPFLICGRTIKRVLLVDPGMGFGAQFMLCWGDFGVLLPLSIIAVISFWELLELSMLMDFEGFRPQAAITGAVYGHILASIIPRLPWAV